MGSSEVRLSLQSNSEQSQDGQDLAYPLIRVPPQPRQLHCSSGSPRRGLQLESDAKSTLPAETTNSPLQGRLGLHNAPAPTCSICFSQTCKKLQKTNVQMQFEHSGLFQYRDHSRKRIIDEHEKWLMPRTKRINNSLWICNHDTKIEKSVSKQCLARASMMDQWIKVLPAKPIHLSSIPGLSQWKERFTLKNISVTSIYSL